MRVPLFERRSKACLYTPTTRDESLDSARVWHSFSFGEMLSCSRMCPLPRDQTLITEPPLRLLLVAGLALAIIFPEAALYFMAPRKLCYSDMYQYHLRHITFGRSLEQCLDPQVSTLTSGIGDYHVVPLCNQRSFVGTRPSWSPAAWQESRLSRLILHC
ncbi:hypothetical protein BJ170DRAFT_134027 [Xylariales sp. AK1849]|nr:hypothetical protein BJ170DRAFT_134027 [Xylariales sp. AK1849]